MVSLQENLASITPSPGARLTAAALSDAIRKAGFRPGAVEVLATGTAAVSQDRWEFRLPGATEPYATAGGSGRPVGEVRLRLRYPPAGGLEVNEDPK